MKQLSHSVTHNNTDIQFIKYIANVEVIFQDLVADMLKAILKG